MDTPGISKQPILLLVGEDHSSATHAISRAGWLEVAKSLIDTHSTEPNILRMLEVSPKRAKQLQSRGYSGVIGFDNETIFCGAYQKLLKYAFKNTALHHTAATLALKEALLATQNKTDGNFNEALDIIDNMDLKELQSFFGREPGNSLLENWYKNILDDKKRRMIIDEFCTNQLLNLSLKQNEITEILQKLEQDSLYNQLISITTASVDGTAAIRQRENKNWANQIREAGKNPKINADVVVVFVGKEHLNKSTWKNDERKNIELDGLMDLFMKNPGLYQKIYIASNCLEDNASLHVSPDPSPDSSSDGSSEKDSSEENISSSDSYSDDSSENEHPPNEEIHIKKMIETIRNNGSIVQNSETNTQFISSTKGP